MNSGSLLLCSDELDIVSKEFQSRSHSPKFSSQVHLPSIIRDDQMHAIGDASQVDGNVRCRCAAIDVGQGFLHEAEQRPLPTKRQFVDVAVGPELDVEPATPGKAIDILLQAGAQPARAHGETPVSRSPKARL